MKSETNSIRPGVHADAAVLPGYHLNKRHWNTVLVDGSLADQPRRDMVKNSYDLVVSKLPRGEPPRSGLARRQLRELLRGAAP